MPGIPIVGQGKPGDVTITLTVKPNGDVHVDTSRPVSMIAMISILSGLVHKGSETLMLQNGGHPPQPVPPDITVSDEGKEPE